jgi:Condensation domain
MERTIQSAAMAESMLVRFQGEGSGVDHLTWGQFTLWTAMVRLGTWLPIGGFGPLPPDTTVDDVADQLRFWMSRYQTLRTRLRFEPDGPRQVVSDHGEIELEIVDADDTEDPAVVAERVEQAYRRAPYDFTSQWPMRMAVIRHRGIPTHHVMIICHLVTDAAGAQVMMADLAARDPITGEAATPAPRMQPLAEARWQRSPAGRRQSESAIRFAEDVVRRMPARRFGGSTDPRQPRYWQVGFSSRAAHLAMLAIGARAGAGPSLVLLTVFMIALARVSGTNPAVAHVLVNNRFRPHLADVVAPHTQAALFMVDVGDATFDEALARTRRRSLVSYKHSYYDQRDIEGLEDRIGKERGEELLVGCFLNDRRLESVQARGGGVAPAPPALAEVRAALAQTRLRYEVEQDESFESLFVNVNDVPDALDIMAQADTHHIAPADLERLLHEVEAVAVAAAFDGSVPTGVPAG